MFEFSCFRNQTRENWTSRPKMWFLEQTIKNRDYAYGNAYPQNGSTTKTNPCIAEQLEAIFSLIYKHPFSQQISKLKAQSSIENIPIMKKSKKKKKTADFFLQNF